MNVNSRNQVFFALSKENANLVAKDSVLICPSGDNWNDFGHETLCDFTVVGSGRWSRFKLAFLGNDDNPRDVVANLVGKYRASVVPGSEFPFFYSMQVSVDNYRELVDAYSPNGARYILTAMNDMVAAKLETPQPAWLDRAKKESAFNYSFIRFPDGFQAYYHAHFILLGLQFGGRSYEPGVINVVFHNVNFENAHHIRFHFSDKTMFPQRIGVIVGKNGVGKSRTLNVIARGLLEGNRDCTDEKGQVPNFTKLVAVCTPGETDATFPPTSFSTSALPYAKLPAISDEKFGQSGESLPEVLDQLARVDEKDPELLQWAIFRRAVSEILPFEHLAIFPNVVATNNDQPQANASSSLVPLTDLVHSYELVRRAASQSLRTGGQLMRDSGGLSTPLSSGQLAFVRLAAQLCLHTTPGSLVLIDEPETHLHPDLISSFIVVLNSILESSQSIAVVATHSAYVVREVPRSQVQVISVSDQGRVEVNNPRIKTFGADIGAISNFIFGDGFINRLADSVIGYVNANPNFNWEVKLNEELSTEAMIYIKRAIATAKH